MTRRAHLFWLALVVGCPRSDAVANAPTIADAEAPTASAREAFRIDAKRLEAELDAYIAQFGREWGEPFSFSGYVLVAQHGKHVYARGFGRSDRSKDAAPGPDTTFRIGSVTKQFTAAAILRLQQQGKLRVNDSVSAHLPDYPETGDRITIHHLLTHTSGIPSYTDRPNHDPTQPHTVVEMLANFANEPLQFEPGTQFRYSNSGYFLLGAIVEAVSGQSYASFLADEVFAPAGLQRTRYGDTPGDDDAATGYMLTGLETTVAAPALDMSNPFAAGALRSTPNDLVRWDAALRGDALLDDAARAMVSVETDRESDIGLGPGAKYAYGVNVGEMLGRRYISHDGGINGFGTDFTRFPDDEIVIVVYTNRVPFPIGVLWKAAVMITFGEEPPPPPPEPTRRPIADGVRKRLAAGYALDDAGRKTLADAGLHAAVIEGLSVVTLEDRGGQLVMRFGDQEPTVLHAAADGSLFTTLDRLTLTFDADAERVDRITARQGALAVDFVRSSKRASGRRGKGFGT